MDPTRLNDHELAILVANLCEVLAGPELSAIDPALRAELLAEFGTTPADFASELARRAVADDEKQAATSAKDQTRGKIIPLVRRTKFALKAGGAPKTQFDLAGLGLSDTRVGQYIAQTPGSLAAIGFSNGVNTGRFSGNNSNCSVMYEIWRRTGTDGIWQIHILTARQTFEDKGVTPGQYYEYRVRARAKKNVSDFSNTTVVYGVL
jgi:hypothetical protein